MATTPVSAVAFAGPDAAYITGQDPRQRRDVDVGRVSCDSRVRRNEVGSHVAFEEIESKVKEIICNQLEVSSEQLRPEASFIDDLKADSLAVVELVLAFEQEFKITIPEEDTEQIKTVKDAVNYIKSHAK